MPDSETRKKWLASPAGRASNKRKKAKYYASPKGKAARRGECARHYAKHKERISSQRKIYLARTRKRRLAAWARYRSDHPISREYAANYRAANPDKFRAYSKRYRESPGGRIAGIGGSHRHRARKAGTSSADAKVIRDWQAKWKAQARVTCYWCRGLFSPQDCHTDHIIALTPRHGGKHEISNLCIACVTCNLRKNAKSVSEWNERLIEPVLLSA